MNRFGSTTRAGSNDGLDYLLELDLVILEDTVPLDGGFARHDEWWW